MEHHLLDGDALHSVQRELGDVVADTTAHVDEPVGDQQPDGRGDDRLRGREDAEAGRVGRIAERLERDRLTVAGDRNLARGDGAGFDVRRRG